MEWNGMECMNVCMYACMYVRMYVCTYVVVINSTIMFFFQFMPNISFTVQTSLWISL